MTSALADFRAAYAAHRASEGRAYDRATLLALPYLADDSSQLAHQWAVRARTYEAFMRRVLLPMLGASTLHAPRSTLTRSGDHAERGARSGERRGSLRLLDLGAGNGWLSWRAAMAGCECVALDLRDDAVDGLGAAAPYLERADGGFARVAASFDALPVAAGTFDVVVFNASVHYATDLAAVLREARRVVRPGGRVVVLDSPFYRRDADGAAMVAEKRGHAAERFGDRAAALMAVPAIEYLTAERLAHASAALGLTWRRRRVRYPLWYELRPYVARLRGRRAPSRFDLWEAHA
ncbi:Methyltransferase type 11 [Gemmatirosa kalamazoonensis]|uniref:Methyltransferase type 11 n=1 Tax=Gemmatirosa kalamazoonensis TaxID=861299 RepID=W0RG61_9BACT|nr:class I SAM-dependent methyltransferase [Gemmatirosa kalamazoonensis]AHG88383.1 Methyltransferase type 11 [Gemmatirosa kalamazoonensis]